MPGDPTRLRADAQENRDRILAAARTLLAERGADVGMRDIARRAHVGPATLYRRFPTKQAVLDEVVGEELRACREIVVEGCADPDPWHGFTSVVERLTARNARTRASVDALTAASAADGTLAEHRRELLRMVSRLADRARRAGRLRADFRVDDLVLVLLAGRGLAAVGPQDRDAAARRFARLAIDAFRAERRAGSG